MFFIILEKPKAEPIKKPTKVCNIHDGQSVSGICRSSIVWIVVLTKKRPPLKAISFHNQQPYKRNYLEVAVSVALVDAVSFFF